MKTRNDDFSGNEYAQELNIAGTFEWNSPDGKYYKAELDISPSSFLSVIAKHCIRKPFPWSEFKRFTDAELENEKRTKPNSRRRGTYSPAGNVNAMIASTVEEKATV